MKKVWISILMLVVVAGISCAEEIRFDTDLINVDDGAIDEAVETFTRTITNFNGTDASFDLVITADAGTNTLLNGGSANNVGVAGGTDGFIDAAGEAVTFTLSVADFNAGTSGYTAGDIGFGMTKMYYGGAGDTGDSGEFTLLNGAAPSPKLVWTSVKGGSDFTGMNGTSADPGFMLETMNDTYGAGGRVTSFKTDWVAGEWTVQDIDVTYAYRKIRALPFEGSWGPRMIIPTPVWPDEVTSWDATAFSDQFTQLTSSTYVMVNVSHPANSTYYTSPNPPLVAAIPELADRFPTRDVLGETLDAIDAAGKKAIVYLATGGFKSHSTLGPLWMNYITSQGFTYNADGVREYIVRYYAQKFGDKIDGWWFDGANEITMRGGPNGAQLMVDAVRSGNPNAIVTFGNHELNDYVGGHPTPRTIADAYSYDYNYQTVTRIEAGPWMDTDKLPVADPNDGALGHIFSHLQHRWTSGGLDFPAWQAVDWTRRVVDAGGMFTWSAPRDTGLSVMLDPQFQVLRTIDTAIGGAKFIQDSFETGFGDWIAGGADCSHYTGPYASHATGAIELTGNTATSFMSTGDLPMSGSSRATVDFGYYATGMGTGDTFELQISTNSGGDYTTVKAWTYSTDFANDEYYNDIAFLEGVAFNDQTRFRIRCYAASGYVYIDDVKMSAVTANPPSPLPVDPKPVFICDPIIKYMRNYAKEGQAYENWAESPIITGSAVDGNGDTLTYSKVSGPAWLSIASNGYLSGTPGAGDVGINEFTVQADDGTGNTTTAQLIITVEANMAPSFTINPINGIVAIEDTALSSSIANDASDTEDDPMTFSKVSGPAWLSVAANGDLSGTPGTGDLGLNTFTVQVVAEGGSDTATLYIAVYGTPDIYEAEDATVGGPNIKSDNPGYTGTGYVDFAGNSGEYVEWTVTVASGDVYDIAFRYALDSGDRPLEIQVNGQVVDPLLSFPDTGSWSTWGYTASLSVTLNAGANTVRTTVTGSSGGNVDYLAVFNSMPPANEGTLYYEDFSVDPGYGNATSIGVAGGTGPYFTFDQYNGTPDIGATTETGVLHLDSNTAGNSARSRGLTVFVDTSAAIIGTYTVSFEVSNWTNGSGTAGFKVFEGSGLDTGYLDLDYGDNNAAASVPRKTGGAVTWTLLNSTWGEGTAGTGITSNGTVSFEVTLTEAGQPGDYLALAWVQVRSTDTELAPTFDVDNVWVGAGDPLSAYGAWTFSYNLTGDDADETADVEYDGLGDGLDNLMEYALGGNPTNGSDRGHVPVFGTHDENGTNWFEYVYARRRDAAARGLEYTVEATSNLLSEAWNTNNVTETGTESIDSDFEAVTNRIPMEAEGFMRLTIEIFE